MAGKLFFMGCWTNPAFGPERYCILVKRKRGNRFKETPTSINNNNKLVGEGRVVWGNTTLRDDYILAVLEKTDK
jgi:hypothetical protein